MYTQKKNYILQLKVSRFHDPQAILPSSIPLDHLKCTKSGTATIITVFTPHL